MRLIARTMLFAHWCATSPTVALAMRTPHPQPRVYAPHPTRLYLTAAVMKTFAPLFKASHASDKIEKSEVMLVLEERVGRVRLTESAAGEAASPGQRASVVKMLKGAPSAVKKTITRVARGIANYERTVATDEELGVQWARGLRAYEGPAVRVSVLLHSADGLRASDASGTSDPYALSLSLSPPLSLPRPSSPPPPLLRPNSAPPPPHLSTRYVILKMRKAGGGFVSLIGESGPCKSSVVEKTLSPSWEERLTLVGPAAEMEGARLLLEVHDSDNELFDMDDKLGQASVSISKVGLGRGAEAVEFSKQLDTQGSVHFALSKSMARVTIEQDGVQTVTSVDVDAV